MRVLIVNKFLFPKGGAEMYALSLGSILEAHGHSVQYFGLRNPKNTVGNAVDASSMTWIFNRHQGESQSALPDHLQSAGKKLYPKGSR